VKTIILETIIIMLVIASGMNTVFIMAEAQAITSKKQTEVERINANLKPGEYEIDISELN